MLRTLFPLETAASFTLRIFGGGIALCLLAAIAARLLRRRRLAKAAVIAALLFGGVWGLLHATNAGNLRVQLADVPDAPQEPKEEDSLIVRF